MSRSVRPEQLVKLHSQTENVRNICILAHVDHGKTTLSDSLVSANGIISPKLAGQLRYLDSREDEQLRGITMQSSAISLFYQHQRIHATDAATAEPENYLINLIDSPGHVDFSADVSTAVRLCDGALIVIDVIEGVCIQTHAVIRQAWEERLRPCLVLNKIDRLVTELQLTPQEAYDHLFNIIQQANAVISSLLNAHLMAGDEKDTGSNNPDDTPNSNINVDANADPNAIAAGSGSAFFDFDEATEQQIFFEPARGNVVFASALDTWAFRVVDFLPLFAEKLGVSKPELQRGLWGDYYWSAKQNKIVTKTQIKVGSVRAPVMFAQFVLQNIWEVYNATVVNDRPKRLARIVETLGLGKRISVRELGRKDRKQVLRSVMGSWLPAARALLSMVVRNVPDPRKAQANRIDALWPRLRLSDTQLLANDASEAETGESISAAHSNIRESIVTCGSHADDPLVLFVSKMVAVPRSKLPAEALAAIDRADTAAAELEAASNPESQADNTIPATQCDDDECFLAFARVFSGVLNVAESNRKLFVLGPKYSPFSETNSKHVSELTSGLQPLMIMCDEFVPVNSMPAGNIVAIAGLGPHILKTATVTSSLACASLSPMPSQSAPILRVSLQPSDPRNWAQLAKGLKLLNRADPVVDVRVQASGEYILGAIGELHLERCIKDLKDRFAKIDIRVSEPVAVFRETVVAVENSRVPVRQKVIDADLDVLDYFNRNRNSGNNDTDNDTTGNNDDLRSEGDGASVASASTAATATTSTTAAGSASASASIVKEKRVKVGKWGQVMASTPNHAIRVFLRILPLPEVIITAIEANRVGLELLVKEDARGKDPLDNNDDAVADLSATTAHITARADARALASQALARVRDAFAAAGPSWAAEFDSVWALGPHNVGPCVLLSHLTEEHCGFSGVLDFVESTRLGRTAKEAGANRSNVVSSLTNSILSGFQIAMRAGPLCEEPMWGVAVAIEAIRLSVGSCGNDSRVTSGGAGNGSISGGLNGSISISMNNETSLQNEVEQLLRSQSGQMISAVKDAVRRGMTVHHQQDKHGVDTECGVRLAEGYLRCELQCHVNFQDGDQLGKLYSVLAKRRAKIVREDMWEGTSIFTIEALIPVVEAFGLADALRIKTSGAASTPQLVFSHWAVLDVDPFFRATTEDELEEYGETGYEESYSTHNVARKFITSVRKRKGLATNEKIVVSAEKQRTLARKK